MTIVSPLKLKEVQEIHLPRRGDVYWGNRTISCDIGCISLSYLGVTITDKNSKPCADVFGQYRSKTQRQNNVMLRRGIWNTSSCLYFAIYITLSDASRDAKRLICGVQNSLRRMNTAAIIVNAANWRPWYTSWNINYQRSYFIIDI